jgi:hypothetical protein
MNLSKKRFIDFINFFNEIHINVKEYYYEEFSDQLKEFPESGGILPPDYHAPGNFVYFNGQQVATGPYIQYGLFFFVYIEKIRDEFIYEFEQNKNLNNYTATWIEYMDVIKSEFESLDEAIFSEEKTTDNQKTIEFKHSNSIINFDLVHEYYKKEAYKIISEVLYYIKSFLKDTYILIQSSNSPAVGFQQSNRDPKIKSFSLQNDHLNYGNIKIVYESLKKFEFIDVNTKLPQFRKLFSHVEITSQVNWIGYKGDIVYFIKQLIKNRVLVNPGKKIWKITAKCFIWKTKFLLDEKSLKGQKKTKKSFELNRIINNFS